MKKLFASLLALAMLLTLAACGTKAPAETQVPTRPMMGGNVQIANPFITCKDLDEAAKIAGFSITLPECHPEWMTELILHAVDKDMIEVIYWGDDDEIRIRKAPGDRDISGVYNDFEKVEEITVGDYTVTLRSNEGKPYIAMWYHDGYTYFIRTVQGLPMEELTRLILGTR